MVCFDNDDPSASLTEMRPMTLTMMLYIACCWPICSQGAISALLTSASGSHLTLITEINDRRPLLNLKSANHAKSIFGSNANQVKFPFCPIWGKNVNMMFYLESWSQIFPNPGGLKWENTTEGKLTFLTFWWRWWWLFQGLWWEFQGFLWWFQSMKMRQWPEWSRSSPCSWKWTHWFPHQPFLNVTCQIFMIPYRFVLCGQPPHVNSQLRISVEEPESTAMTSSRMTVTTRGSWGRMTMRMVTGMAMMLMIKVMLMIIVIVMIIL